MNVPKLKIGEEAIFDATVLGTPRFIILGVQHMFAMFGSTVLVPLLTGLSVSTTLLFAGLGTLLFHLVSKKKVPAFLGSSFAFLAGYMTIAPNGEPELLPYACFGVACAGLVYLILAFFFKTFGANKVMRYFPPIVTGPIIIAIGLNLSQSAINSCSTNWFIALVAIIIIVACNIEACAEAFTLAQKAGVDPQVVYKAIRGGLAGSTVMDAKVPMMLEGNDKPGFRVDLHIKDLNNALDCAHAVGAAVPMTAQVQEVLYWLHNHGKGTADHSAIEQYYEAVNGIKLGR